ncbi:MAG: PDZ domain-containing protein [Gemmatimonadota bacterium]|nr:PDZ domain-containing protein [Gemmatimonadota bacterium]
MTGMKRGLGIGLALATLAGWPSVARAQVASGCAADEWAVASVGITGFECNCTIQMQAGNQSRRSYEFRAEPRVLGVRRGGPADGKLEHGDVIVAIDGHLITTREGMRRFGAIEAGTPVSLTVRRGGREVDVAITPDQECERGLPPAAPRAPRAAAAGVATPAPPAPVARPARPAPPAPLASRGRLGMSVQCTECSVDIRSRGAAPTWGFTAPPTIERVEPNGPAAKAGLRANDVLTHIDGVPLTDEDGGRRFGAVAPGDTVRLRYQRGDQTGNVTLVAGESLVGVAAGVGGAVGPRPPRAPRAEVNRFSGVIGDAFVEVSGGPIIVERTEDVIVIRSQDITVRITKGGTR